MADVQIAVIDTTENVVNVAVPGVQGPIGLTGSVTIAQAGTAATPGIRFESDTNTGIYSPGADQLAVSTGGTGRLFIDSSGNVGLGTASPSATLELSGTGTVFKANTATTTSTAIALQLGGLVTSSNSGCFIKSHVNLGSTLNSQLSFEVNGGALEAVRIDSSGRLLVGTSTSRNLEGQAGAIQVEGDSGSNSSLFLIRNSVNSGRPTLSFGKSRGVGAGAVTAVSNGDFIGVINWSGADGTSLVSAATISCEVDGTPGTNDMPGRLVFSTTADGASSPTERMRISQNGNTYIGTTADLTSDTNKLHVSGTRAIVGRATGGAAIPVITSWNDATSGDNTFVSFRTETTDTERGTIDYNRAGGQVRYNVTSDSRLKSEIQPAASALDNLAAIQVRAYKWTETDYQINYGFVAQELNEVAPDAVKEGDYGEEITDVWAVDNSKLVPLLTKALQEAIAKIETLEAAVTALQQS